MGLGADACSSPPRAWSCSACSSPSSGARREPVLPIAVLRDEVFRIAALLSLIVGFALFGSVTFLPLFFQTVFESSPTDAGLRLIPLMGGSRARPRSSRAG